MKTLAQQYQDLLNFIDSAHSLKLSDIANICENATMEFCQNLPSEFDYKVSYSEYYESVEIVANVKGQSEKTFSVTKGMIARIGTNDCNFAKRLAFYKESLNIEALSENAQKLRLEKQEVAKEEDTQEVKSNTLIDAINKLQKEHPNFESVTLFFYEDEAYNGYGVVLGEGYGCISGGNFIKPSAKEIEEANRLLPDFKCRFSFYGRQLIIKIVADPIQEKAKEEVKEDLYSDIGLDKELVRFIERIKEDFIDINRIFILKKGSYSYYNYGITHINTQQLIEKDLSMSDFVKLGMYIERRNQLNKK